MNEAVERFQMEAAMYMVKAEQERTRPCVLFRPKLMREGNRWMALYGDNIQDGIAGFGFTAESAMREFDRVWFEDGV